MSARTAACVLALALPACRDDAHPAPPEGTAPPATATPPGESPAAPADERAPAPPSAPEGMTYEQHQASAPGPPGRVEVQREDGRAVVSWHGTRDDSIGGYVVYRRCGEGDWEEAGRVPLRADDPRNRGEYRLEDRRDSPCEYTVAAFDPGGAPGPKTADLR